MKVQGKDYRTVWMKGGSVFMIEQNLLPFEFSIHECRDHLESCEAITSMIVRGAGAIGATAAYAMAQSFMEAEGRSDREEFLARSKKRIENTRPTARNLFYAVDKVWRAGRKGKEEAMQAAQEVADRDAKDSQAIGRFGNEIIRDGARIATHCNAGWLAFVDYGTALSPVYTAVEKEKNVFVYVDETRPRGQGARLTAWELHNAGVPHRIIPDNAAAWYMSRHQIDLMIVGADRIAANGDVANKIGTLEKALAAKEFGIPFYVAAPTTTIDLDCSDGDGIRIEERSENEVLFQRGPDRDGIMREIRVASPGSSAFNPAFDITPARLVTGIITEMGIISPTPGEIAQLFGRVERP